MHEKYKKRCLYKTLSFFIDLQIPCKPIELSEKDIQIDTFFNRREFSQVKNIVCQSNCSCCTVENKFALFYSQIIQNKLLNLESQVITNESDPFCMYIEAVQTKNPSVIDLLEILLQEPYFFEAFEVVLYATTRENIYVIEREINKLADTILKGIYFMLIYVCKSIKCQNFDNHFTKLLEYFGIGNASYLMSGKENSINESYKMNYAKYKTLIPQSKDNLYMQALIAAVYYVKKDNEKAQNIFNRIKDKTPHFMDLYSNMLYVKNDTVGLAALALHMSTVHVYKPETYGVLGNYYSLLKDNTNAIRYFEKAIKVDSRCYTNYTLIAYEYTSMEKYNVAIDNFNRALKHNKNDYRALFGLAELYKSLKMYGISMILYKRAAEVHSDNGYCWLSFGIILIRLERYDDAVHALERSISLGEKDALLKLGDCYKKMKRFDEAVGMYEQYVEKQKDPRMIKFLQDYHRKANNVEKAEYYTNLQ